MKTRILYLTVHLRYGGAEVGLLTTLKNIDRSRYDCSVVSIEPAGEIGRRIEKLGYEVIYLNSSATLFNIALIWRIAGIMRKKKPDILHASLFYANYFGRMAALFSRPGSIVTEERSMYTEKRFYHILIDRMLSAVTDSIIVCSNAVLEFTAIQERISKDKFRLIYNSVDSDAFNINDTRESVRGENGFSKDDFIIGTIGSLIPKKGHEFLVEAVARIQASTPNLKLMLVGDGSARGELEELVRSRGLNSRTVFLGWRSDIPRLMKSMDVFVLPSLQEGFPRTIVEAMYAGLPVIASRIGGIPEIVTDGQNGFLSEPGDAGSIAKNIESLSVDKRLRERLGANARAGIISSYLPVHYMSQLEALYGELAESSKR